MSDSRRTVLLTLGAEEVAAQLFRGSAMALQLQGIDNHNHTKIAR